MPFEAVRVGRAVAAPVEPGWVSIAKTGTARLYRDDLALVDIGDEVALLVDTGTLRIAMRRPRLPEDDGSIVRVSNQKRCGRPVRGRANVNFGPAIRQLGLTLSAVAGRYELMTKDDLITVALVVGQRKEMTRQAAK